MLEGGPHQRARSARSTAPFFAPDPAVPSGGEIKNKTKQKGRRFSFKETRMGKKRENPSDPTAASSPTLRPLLRHREWVAWTWRTRRPPPALRCGAAAGAERAWPGRRCTGAPPGGAVERGGRGGGVAAPPLDGAAPVRRGAFGAARSTLPARLGQRGGRLSPVPRAHGRLPELPDGGGGTGEIPAPSREAGAWVKRGAGEREPRSPRPDSPFLPAPPLPAEMTESPVCFLLFNAVAWTTVAPFQGLASQRRQPAAAAQRGARGRPPPPGRPLRSGPGPGSDPAVPAAPRCRLGPPATAPPPSAAPLPFPLCLPKFVYSRY